ncbi:uncharacterized protein ACRADG_003340 [Cochliomyia hominivorax]
MFFELNNHRISLEIGQLYMLGKQRNDLDSKIKYFIELDGTEEVDQKHCVIDVCHSEEIFVYDLFSLKGTKLNDKRLNPLEKIRLKNGDILQVGQQEIKYINDHPEVSHDSSGFLEVNRNTSDVIASSPDSTSQTESRLKRNNYNNFLVPSIPIKKSAIHNISANSSNTHRSDSFTIPETQYCKPRNSLNDSNFSIAESITDENRTKFLFSNLDNFDTDDLCIPETQEALPFSTGGISCSQRPHLLSNVKDRSTLPEESSNSHDLDDSQFRICTQDYNEGFGEEAEAMQSQIIALIKHKTVILNDSGDKSQNSLKSCNESDDNNSKSVEDNELSAIKWPGEKRDLENAELRADCSTPDIFEFGDEDTKGLDKTENGEKEKCNLKTANRTIVDDEKDLLPTQVFPLSIAKTTNKSLKEQDKNCLIKEREEVLPLSDKENRCPVTLEPITDLPPTQLFANEVSSARSSSSSTSHNSVIDCLKSTAQTSSENKDNLKISLLKLDKDEEDDILTQALLQPFHHPVTSINSNKTKTIISAKCFNSTVLEDNFTNKNLHTFFAEIEKTPSKQTITSSPSSLETVAVLDFRKPDKDKVVLKKIPPLAILGNDLDLLMCTPQLIKEHMFLDKNEDLKKDILEAKNRNLFVVDSDEDKEDDDPQELVKFINKPKDNLDFDKLLPHLNKKSQESPKKNGEKNIKEDYKKHKLNLSFGKDQQETKSFTMKSSNLSRDDRHTARDKKKELVESKQRTKIHKRKVKRQKETEEIETILNEEYSFEQENSSEKDKKRKHRERHEIDDKESNSRENINEHKNEHKRQTKESKALETKESKSRKRSTEELYKSEQKCIHKNEPKKQTKENDSETKDLEVKDKPKEMPARRLTRAKSKLEVTNSISMNVTKVKQLDGNTKEDDLNSDKTQPFLVRVPSRCLTTKECESQSSVVFNNSRKTAQGNKSKRDSSLSHNNSTNDSLITKLSSERKRKSETTNVEMSSKIERKRLRSTHSINSIAENTSKILISMTMVDQELFKALAEDSKGVWHVAKDPSDSEILVMDKAFRTFKFLLAMARGISIVTSDYLKKLNQTQSVENVKIQDYLFADAEFEQKHKCSLIKSQQKAKKYKLFKGYEFVMTRNILPNPREIQAIIEASGGFVYNKMPSATKDNQKIYLVSSKEDKKDWHKYRRINKEIIIVSTEAIMSAIMRQSCESMSSYTLA